MPTEKNTLCINASTEEVQKRNQKNEIFIQPEYIIVNLIQADKKQYLTISRLFRFVSYLRRQLSEMEEISANSDIIFDINFDSIERTVRCHDKVFDLIGDTIVVNDGELPDIPECVSSFLPKLALKFATEFAA